MVIYAYSNSYLRREDGAQELENSLSNTETSEYKKGKKEREGVRKRRKGKWRKERKEGARIER